MRHRILISAYAVSPIRGSECAVGWQICRRLGKYHDIVVLHVAETPSNMPYAKEIKKWEEENSSIPGVTFMSVKMPKYSRFFTLLHDFGFWPAYYWGYKSWQKAAFRKAKELHKHKPFDLVHQLNMIGFREPGYLWKLDIPFVWGPVGGFAKIPKEFIKDLNVVSRFFQNGKNIINEYQQKYSRRPILAAKKSSKIWTIDSEGLRIIGSVWGVNSELMLETGTEIIQSGITCNLNLSPLHLVWSGQVIFSKLLHILLHAIHQLDKIPLTLSVVGDGNEKISCQKLAIKLNIENKIKWNGWLPHEEAIKCVKESDILIHTSVKEGTPHAVLEALTYGKPVICHDCCGMGKAVTDKCGIKIPTVDPKTSIDCFAKAILKLHENRTLLNDLSVGAIKRAIALTWDDKTIKIAHAYSEILDSKVK